MITRDSILEFNNEVMASLNELDAEIAEHKSKLNQLQKRRDVLGATHEAIRYAVGADDRPRDANQELKKVGI